MSNITIPPPTKTPVVGQVPAGAPTHGAVPIAQTPAAASGAGTVPASAGDLLKQTLIDWGLSSLLPHLQDYLTKGYDSNTINLALQTTPEWQTRFAGNELRKTKGLPVLTPAQYIATEEQYRQVMQSYGLPAGFYDSHDDFNQFIGNDVSPSELSTRAQIAHDQYINAPAATKALWQQYYGGAGDAIAGILDPTKATQLIQDQANQVAIGGAAAQQGIAVNQQRAQQFQQHGTTLAQAQNAYQKIALAAPTDQAIATRFGQSFGQTQEENDLLLGDAAATQQRQSLYSSEENLFQGHSGADTTSAGVSQSY